MEAAMKLDIDILPTPPDVDDDARDAVDEGSGTERIGTLKRDRRRPYTYTELQAECAKQRERADRYRDALVTVFEHGRSFLEPTLVGGMRYHRFVFRLDAQRSDVAVAADPLACAEFCAQQRRSAAGMAYGGGRVA